MQNDLTRASKSSSVITAENETALQFGEFFARPNEPLKDTMRCAKTLRFADDGNNAKIFSSPRWFRLMLNICSNSFRAKMEPLLVEQLLTVRQTNLLLVQLKFS